jgi:hypothetical protein
MAPRSSSRTPFYYARSCLFFSFLICLFLSCSPALGLLPFHCYIFDLCFALCSFSLFLAWAINQITKAFFFSFSTTSLFFLNIFVTLSLIDGKKYIESLSLLLGYSFSIFLLLLFLLFLFSYFYFYFYFWFSSCSSCSSSLAMLLMVTHFDSLYDIFS